MACRCGRRQARRGLTLIETLVAIFIVGLLIALLLPAIGLVRERSKRLSCSANLRQIALAVHAYHTQHGLMPALYNGRDPILPPKYRLVDLSLSWQTILLPLMEQQAVFNQFDYAKQPAHAANAAPVNVVLPLLLCPSTPEREPNSVPTGHPFRFRGLYKYQAGMPRALCDWNLTAAVTDYKPSVEYHSRYDNHVPTVRLFGAWGEVYRGTNALDVFNGGDLGVQRRRRFADITDGLTNTILLTEQAGLPRSFVGGGYMPADEQGEESFVSGEGAWAISPIFLGFSDGTQVDGDPNARVTVINRGTGLGPNSFHSGGVNAAFCDGSVRFLSESLESQEFGALLSRDGGDAVATSD